MKKNIIYIFLIGLVLFFNINKLNAQTIDFDSVLSKAVTNSYDLKMAKVDISLSKTAVKDAQSDYYPKISAGYNSEYNRDLNPADQGSNVVYVGNNAVNNSTAYQDLFYMSAQYNLYDFGAKGKKLYIAKKDVDAKTLTYSQNIKETASKLLDIYTQSLLSYKELKAKNEILPVYKDLFLLKERLYNAGSVSKVEMADAAIRVAKTVDEIDVVKSKLKSSLKDLSFYTRENYSLDDTQIHDFDDESLKNLEMDYEKTPEYQIYQIQIKQKEAELSAIRRQYMPTINLYSNYNIYGSNMKNIPESFEDMRQRSASLGISAQMTPFDGFKNLTAQKKAQLELTKIRIDRDKKLAEMKNEFEKLSEQSEIYGTIVKNKMDVITSVQAKIVMLEKLSTQRLIDKSSLLTEKAEIINDRLDLDKTAINKISIIKKMKILSGDYVLKAQTL